jgi:hypothetical protein
MQFGAVCIAALGLTLFAQSALAWDQIDEKEDDAGNSYVIYRRDKKGSDFKEYKLVTLFDAPVKDVVAAVRAIGTESKYVMDNSTRKLLKKEGKDTYYYYSTFDHPMVSTRDLTNKFFLTFKSATQSYVWKWQTANDLAPPLPGGFVRIPDSVSSWELSPADGNKTLGTYQSYANPGGMIPAWLANSGNMDAMSDMMNDLRAIIAKRKKR